MTLRLRLVITAVAAALPVALGVYFSAERLRQRDRYRALDRFAVSQITDDARARCESNPNWFLAGPRPDRPSPEQLAAPDADVHAPRPPVVELPFEYFAYDDGFQPLSTAGPRFPADLRLAMRGGAKVVSGPFPTREGTGQQEAISTGWTGSPCAVLLFRLRPAAGQSGEGLALLAGAAAAIFVVAFATGAPIVARIRRLASETRRAAAEEYRSAVTIGGRDEVSAVAFAFNEAGTLIRDRTTDIRDREDNLRRFIAAATDQVAVPLANFERGLAAVESAGLPEAQRAALRDAVVEAHTLAMRLQNLAAAATLKMSLASRARDAVDLPALVRRVAEKQAAFAHASGVHLHVTAGGAALVATSDAGLLEQSVNNLVDNAIRYNRPGGHVEITLDRTRDGRFSLRVDDDGPGAPDEVLANLNAIRRFRGDEGRKGAGEIGLGLAVVREAGDRLGIKWAFRRSARGWFQAELTGPFTSSQPAAR